MSRQIDWSYREPLYPSGYAASGYGAPAGSEELGQAPDYYGVFGFADNGMGPAGYTGGVAGQKFSIAFKWDRTVGTGTGFQFYHPTNALWMLFSIPSLTGWQHNIANPDNSFPNVGTMNMGNIATNPRWVYLTYQEINNTIKGYEAGLVPGGIDKVTANWNPLGASRRWQFQFDTPGETMTFVIFDNYHITADDVAILESGWTP